MADLDYSVGVNTRQARRSLGQLNDRVQRSSEAFGKLKQTLAGLAIGGFVTQAVNGAAAVDRLSRATGIATDNIVNFSRAFSNAGGTIEQGRDVVSDFSEKVGEARRESEDLRQAFRDVGVSLDDPNLSQGDMFDATIQALANLEDESKRATIQNKLFGEALKGIPLEQVAREYSDVSNNVEGTGDAYRNAADASRALSNAFTVLREEIVLAISPILDVIGDLDNLRGEIRFVIQALLTLAGVWAGFKVFTGIIAGAKAATGALVTLKATIIATAASSRALVARLGVLAGTLASMSVGGLVAGFRALAGVFALVGRNLLRLVPYVGAVVLAFEGINWVVKQVTGSGLIDWIKVAGNNMSGFADKVADAVEKMKNLHDEYNGLYRLTGNIKNLIDEEFSDGVEIKLKYTHPGRPGGDSGERSMQRAENEKLSEQESRMVDLYKKQKLQLQESVRTYKQRTEATADSLRTQIEMLDMTDQQANAQRRINQFNADYESQINSLIARYRELNLEPEKNAELIKKVEESIQAVMRRYEEQLPIVRELSKELAERRAQAEAVADAERRAAEAARTVQQATRSTTDTIAGMRRETEDMKIELNEMNLDPLQRQLNEIERTISRDTKDTVKELKQELETLDDPEARASIQAQIARVRTESQAIIDEQQRIARETYEQQRSFSQGWSDAFREYQENATNSAKTAEAVFKKTTQGMEDMIVDFAKTGKFEFKSFMSTVLEELLRSQVRQLMAQTFGSLSSIGGGSGSSGGNSGFSGFFANGGMIPQGGYGIVGEHGPERVSGPAQVTPENSGGNVTVNISAVDANSFKQLVARDPEFITAVAEKGRRSQPQTRR